MSLPRRTPFLVWALCLAMGLGYIVRGVHLQADLSNLLPRGTSTTQRLLLEELRSGATQRLILIGLEGAETEALAETSRRLAAWMRASGDYRFVANGTEDGTAKQRDLLFQYRYLLSPALTADSFEPGRLHEALERRLGDLVSPWAPMVKGLVASDPTGELLAVLQIWAPAGGAADYRGVWFAPDHRRAVLMAETKAPGFDFDAQERLQQQLRQACEWIASDAKAGPVRLVMTGPAVFAVEVQQGIEDEAQWLALVASSSIIAFLLLTYRSVRILALSLIPLASGIVAGVVVSDLCFGFVHGITLAFGITLLGVVDDYPIHLFSHMARNRSAQAVMKALWPTMGLGVITTALGFSGMLLSGFPGLAQLGTLAVSGLFAAAAATRWVLPGMVPQGFEPRYHGARLPYWFDRVAQGRALVPVSVLSAVVALLWSDTPLWEQDVNRLTPISSVDQELDRALRRELGAPDIRYLIVVEAADEEAALRRSETLSQSLDRLVQQGELTGYDMAARYLPSRKTQRDRQALLPSIETLEHNLAAAAADLPFKPGVFQPFLNAVAEAKEQAPLDYHRLAGTALEPRLSTLLVAREGRWIALVPLRGVADGARLRTRVQAWRDPQVSYMDFEEESNIMVTTYRDEALVLLGWGGLAIAIVLGLGLREPGTLLRVILPLVSATLCVAALLHAFGERLSLFHLASFLLVIGLGLDYALFFNRPHDSREDRGRTLYGLVVCSSTTILVFGILAGSGIPALRAIGITAALGSLGSLVFAALLARKETRDA